MQRLTNKREVLRKLYKSTIEAQRPVNELSNFEAEVQWKMSIENPSNWESEYFYSALELVNFTSNLLLSVKLISVRGAPLLRA